jgi:flagellar basal-body rod modification protein FlgD
MAAVAGILNHQMTAGQALAAKSATPMASGNSASSTSSSSSDAGTISANDFLTLLVTEMKNQDPTATTDPNEYINQLVNVNSLQQLISINQTLTTDLTAPTTTSKSSTASPGVTGAAKSPAGSITQIQPATTNPASGAVGAIHQAASALAPGNLGVPAANASASRVAQSLSGRPRLE